MYDVPGPEELRELRLKAGLTQTELAKRAEVSQPLVARIESGDVDPRASTLKKILLALREDTKGEGLSARDVMKSPVVHVRPNGTLSNASKIMEEHGFSQLPVISDGIQIGSISERSVIEELTKERDFSLVSSKSVSQVMSHGFPTISPDTDIGTLSRLIGTHPAVLVVEMGKVEGIITRADLLKFAER
ncbi:MAG: XRE family transcriptional regulator [Candidatus Hydrothermarchaeaceae archaeon]